MQLPMTPPALQHRSARPYRALPLSFVRRMVRLRRPLVAPLNLWPLIGVLLVMTLFLLPQFQASGEVLCLCKRLPLPQASHVAPLEPAPIVTISLDSVALNGDPKAQTSTVQEDTTEGLIQPLYDDLTTLKKNYQLLHPESSFPGIVNLQAEKQIRYRVIRRVLAICAVAGFDIPHFVVETAPELWFLP